MLKTKLDKSIERIKIFSSFKSREKLQRGQNQENGQETRRVKDQKSNAPDQRKSRMFSISIRNYKVKFDNLKSFSQNRLKNRKNSLLSNIYRPSNQNKYKNEVCSYLNDKNISLIKENIKRLQIRIPSQVPSLFKTPSKHKLQLNYSSLKQQPKTERALTNSSSREQTFLFEDQKNDKQGWILKRRGTNHFDRTKYFNCQNYPTQVHNKNSLNRREKTQYRFNKNVSRQNLIKEKAKQNKYMPDEFIPIVKSKTQKPKTAGGFLKKHDIQELCLRPDFQLDIDQNCIF